MGEIGRQHFEKAAARADELIALSRRLGDEDLLLEAIHCRWGTAHYRGEVALALELGRDGAKRYDRARHAKFADEYGGHDVGVCALGVQAQSLVLAGLPVQANAAAESCLALAEALNGPNSLMHAFSCLLQCYQTIGERENCARIAERLLQLARKLNLAPPLMVSEFHAAWSQVEDGDAARGLARMQSAFERRSLYPMQEFYHCAFMAQTLASVGRCEEALEIVTSALVGGARSQIGFSVPELWRLKGELLLAVQVEARNEAQRCLERAVSIAQMQGALLIELRAATSLARLLANSEQPEAAAALLRPLYNRFSEGFKTQDVSAAAHVLDKLATEPGKTSWHICR
jgi:hypothetical protein